MRSGAGAGGRRSIPVPRMVTTSATTSTRMVPSSARSFDLKWHPPTRNGAWYVGGGLNWSHASSGGNSGSDTGLNLLTGLESRRGPTRPYVEAKFILDNGSSFQLVGGISWH